MPVDLMMNAPEHDQDRSAAIKRVNETLRGPVADILGNSMPELEGLSREDIYDQVLNKPSLLTKVFAFFREQRHKFRHVVRDKNSRPVLDDTVVLSCGRTLEEVIAMVVRTSAKRYFRQTKTQLSADELYDAIKDYLMHEWQVPLVPTYADMSPEMVHTLGARLLVMREQAELRSYIDGASPQSQDVQAQDVPLPVEDSFAIYLTLDGRRLRPEAFLSVMDQPQILDILRTGPDEDTLSGLTDVFWKVGGAAARILFCGLGLLPEQLGIMLVTAHAQMGKDVFNRLFGIPGQPELVIRLVQQGQSEGIGKTTPLAECAGFIINFVKRATEQRQKDTETT